jgi:hypothetical protein
VDLVDPSREAPQALGVGRDGELVKVLSLLREQADVELLSTEIESGVQHFERVLLGARFAVNTASVSPREDPSSWQSIAGAGAALADTLAFMGEGSLRLGCGACPV